MASRCRAICRLAAQHKPGETVTLRVQRDEQEFGFQIRAWRAIDLDKFTLVEMPDATEKQKRIREGWLKGTEN